MLDLTKNKIDFYKPTIDFIKNLQTISRNSTDLRGKKKSIWAKIRIVIVSIRDTIDLLLLKGKRSFNSIVFIGPHLINYERFLSNHIITKAIYINYHNTKLISTVNGTKVFNLGIIANIYGKIRRERNLISSLNHYNRLFNLLYKFFPVRSIYIPCFYDVLGFSLIFDKHRNRFLIVEVQHGGICNFQPYINPVDFKISDKIYVNNQRTAKFLKEHLYKNTEVEIIENEERPIIKKDKKDSTISILYFSSIEVNGLHPVLLKFLEKQDKSTNYKFYIRLHPREKHNEATFRKSMEYLNIRYEFDNSKYWVEEHLYENIVIVTPWSSVVEEAVDNNIVSIIIDDYGKQRYKDLIDNKICFYSTDIEHTMKMISRKMYSDETI